MTTPRVVGLGGVFIKARDPKQLRDWYRRHLRLNINEQYGGCELPLNDPPQPCAYSVFSVFGEDSKYFDPSPKSFMLNFRVADLSSVLAALREEGFETLARRSSPVWRWGVHLSETEQFAYTTTYSPAGARRACS